MRSRMDWRKICAALSLLSAPVSAQAQQAPAKTPAITDVGAFAPIEAIPAGKERPLPTARNPAARLPRACWDAMRAYSDAHGGVGLIVLVDGKVVGEHYRGEYGPATQTLSQSMHKSVVALAYGIALRDGIIHSIDDPVSRYLKEWQDDPRGTIPIRAFLTMSSGLKNYSIARRDPETTDLIFSKDIAAVALATPRISAPYTTFSYSNFDAQIAGLVLERAVRARTGKRYAAWLSDTLWRPLGNGPASVWLDRDGGTPHYFAWLETGLRSWARIGELIRLRGRVGSRQIVPAPWIDQMSAPSPRNPNYGFFVWRGTPWQAQRRYAADNALTIPHSAPYAVDDILFFDGFGGQRVYISPSRRLVIARTGEVDLGFDDAMLPNLALAGLDRHDGRP